MEHERIIANLKAQHVKEIEKEKDNYQHTIDLNKKRIRDLEDIINKIK